MTDPIGKNDPVAYTEAAERVITDGDKDVWVVERKTGEGDYRVSAVLTSYEDAQAYMDDMRDFIENCPEDAPEAFARNTVSFRYGGRDSATKLFEEWPPNSENNEQ